MRVIQVITPSNKTEEVIELLEREEVDFAVTDETSNREFGSVVTFPVETEEVEDMLDKLRGVGVEKEGYVNVLEAEAIVSDKYEEKKEEEKEDKQDNDSERIARQELKATAEGLSRNTPNYIVFTIVSAIVATAGLILDSPSIVVGSMVIAPLIGPAMASSVGTVIKDDELFFQGVKSQFVGVGVSIFSATVFAAIARVVIAPELNLYVINQIAERINPGILSLAVALGAGIAGALSLTSGASAALVGVMIAVALIPPAATVGLGIAYLDFNIVLGSFILVLVNLLSINLAGLVTLWVKGYRPELWYEEDIAKKVTIQRIILLLAGVLILTSFLTVTTINQRQNDEFQRNVEEILEGLDTDIISIEYTYDEGFLFRSPETIRIHTGSQIQPSIIKQRIEQRTGKTVEVIVITESIQRE